MVQLDLSKLDSSTLAALWNDSSVNWSKLSKPDLFSLVAGMVPNNGIYYPNILPLRGLNSENSKFLKIFS